jgi:hypothetical protein
MREADIRSQSADTIKLGFSSCSGRKQNVSADLSPRPINENAHSSGWTGGAVEAVVAGRAGAAA